LMSFSWGLEPVRRMWSSSEGRTKDLVPRKP
jgi:hypothetical protein